MVVYNNMYLPIMVYVQVRHEYNNVPIIGCVYDFIAQIIRINTECSIYI